MRGHAKSTMKLLDQKRQEQQTTAIPSTEQCEISSPEPQPGIPNSRLKEYRVLRKLNVGFPYDHVHAQVYTQKKGKQGSPQKLMHKCSYQHYSQQPKTGNHPNVHCQRNGQRRCGLAIQWNIPQPEKRKEVLRHGRTSKTL